MKNRNPTDKQVEAAIRAGFGQGDGDQHKPWVFVRDVASHGRSWMTHSLRTGRTHHYTSDAQRQIHLLLDYRKDIISIRDQIALLPRDETVAIAERMGLEHPKYGKGDVQKVLCTPILASQRSRTGTQEIAVEVTPATISARLAAELVVKRVYWERRGVQWLKLSPKNIPQPKASNICFFHAAVSKLPPATERISAELLRDAIHTLWHPSLSLNELVHAVAKELVVTFTVALAYVADAALQNHISLDNSVAISHLTPLPLMRS